MNFRLHNWDGQSYDATAYAFSPNPFLRHVRYVMNSNGTFLPTLGKVIILLFLGMMMNQVQAVDVSFATPSHGQHFSSGSDVYVKVNASDRDGIRKVKLYLNGRFVRTENYAPYDWAASKDHEFNNMAPGTYVLKAKAIDNRGYYKTTQITIYVGNGGCQNLTYAGKIEGGESKCGAYDPAPISSAALPSGGSGNIEYVWVSVTDYSNTARPNTWKVYSNSNSSSFDPGTISQTTWYRRCARRVGCDEYTGESNWIKKEVNNCPPPVPTSECVAIAYAPGSHAFWMPGFTEKGMSKNFYWVEGKGSFELYDDNTAQLTGRIVNAADASVKFDVMVDFIDPKTWSEWSAMGGTYKGSFQAAKDNHQDWIYSEMVGKIVGTSGSKYAGMTINLTQRPVNGPHRSQYGKGANDKDGDFGLSTWFYIDSEMFSDKRGDINVDIDCGDSEEICDGIYTLKLKHSGQVLDIHGGSKDKGGKLIQWGSHGGKNQQFFIEKLNDGTYRIKAMHSGMYLDAKGWGTGNGTNVHQWTWHGGNNQRWTIESAGNGYYKIRNVHNGLCLDVQGYSQNQGATAYLWNCHDGPNQKFKLIPIDVADCNKQQIPVSLGNRIWNDLNGDGNIDDGEPGIDEVIVELFVAGSSTPIASTTTENGGYYLFPEIDTETNGADFVVCVAAENFQQGGALEGLISSEGNGGDDNVDSDDNGIDNGARATEGVCSETINLSAGNEPEGESDVDGSAVDPADDNSSNLTVDFGFLCPPSQVATAYATDAEEAGIDTRAAHAFWMDFQGFVPTVPGTTDPTQAGAGPLATGAKLYWKFVTTGTARIDALGGTAQLTGELVNTKVPGLKLVLDLKLTDGQTWEEWKASNPGIADEELFAAQGYRSPRDPDTGEYGPGTTEIIKECADYLNWIYFAVDNSSTATFVNESAGTDYDYLNGITLQIKNLDDITKRVQYGIGANDKDCDLGIGGWFLVEGSIPDPINGGSVAMKVQGDANVDLEIEKTFDCPEPTAVVEEPARFGSVDQTLPTEAQAFKIYPNPASNVLFIEGTNTAEGSYFIEVVDMTGSVMIQRKTQGFDNFKLNVSNFARGFYVVRIVDNNGSNSTFKFLKK